MIQYYVSNSDGDFLKASEPLEKKGETLIRINPQDRYQQIDGFGASFTDSAAYLVDKILDEKTKKHVMAALFDSERGIGLSLLRNPMGASDYARKIYSYDDLPEGETDADLRYFSIQPDCESILPLTKWAVKLNPQLKVIASPWSAPGWMKDSGKMVTGQLLKKYYATYAEYFCRFIKSYAAEGLVIYGVTPQNEPLFVPGNYPGMFFPVEAEIDFVKNYLKPSFMQADIRTKIFGYDHNWDRIDYPFALLDQAAEVFDGICWHWYGGNPRSQERVGLAYPDQEIHFSEGSGGEWIPAVEPAFSNLMRTGIDILRYGSKSMILWNIALDEQNGPTVPGFGTSTCRGLLKINQQTRNYEFTVDYFGLAHFSKWVEVGATRIFSEEAGGIKTVAFENRNHSIVTVLFNTSEKDQFVTLLLGPKRVTLALPSKAAGTCIFSEKES